MIRRIIEIDREKCDGCGLCAEACHEGAISLVDGKAALLRDDYCDGLGDCLPVCPMEAISFINREALDYDEEAVKLNQTTQTECCCCAGPAAHTIQRLSDTGPVNKITDAISELKQWPVQIKLAPVKTSYFNNADLLIAADCAAYARAGFHGEFMRGKITLIGCSKLDDIDYSAKLATIIADNNIRSITVVRMEVPCCGGMEQAVARALNRSGKEILRNVITIGTNGEVLT
ncbi:MAG: 4Fe-4S binding protein [Peptococcaceae bacterium]|nr:4Fe-4S binding protein [Peptococcaceae bacterium]